MTLANKITMARLAITPLFFILFQLLTWPPLNISGKVLIFLLLLLLLLFMASEFSDLLDGIMARRLGQVSGVGKLLDPFSDVISRLTYFFCFYQLAIMPTYAFILILWREICMLFVRQLVQLSGQGPLPARWAGKVKAVVYFVATALSLLLFLFRSWPGSPYQQIMANTSLEQLCAFTLNSHYYQNMSMTLHTVLSSWLLPLSFLLAVLLSWYSFILYLRDFLPALRKLL